MVIFFFKEGKYAPFPSGSIEYIGADNERKPLSASLSSASTPSYRTPDYNHIAKFRDAEKQAVNEFIALTDSENWKISSDGLIRSQP